MKRGTETDLVRNCLDLLRLRGVFSWRNNSGAMVLGTGPQRRFFRAGLVGSADILGIVQPDGRFLAVEAKVGRNKQTAAQFAFEAAIRDAGGLYFLVRSVKDLDDLLKENGI